MIIIGLIIAIVISGISVSLAYNQEIKLATGMITSDKKPQPQRILSDPICFVVDRATSGETGSAVTMGTCFTLKQFEEIGCTKPMLEHLNKHSNILDFESDGAYYLDFIGLPDGMSQEKFEGCWDVFIEKRTNLLENTIPEPEPEPEPIPDSESLQRQKQQQAKLGVQEIIIEDTRGHENKINAIRDYREEFESGYFLEQFIIPNKQNFEKDELINFVYGEWGHQPKENTSVKIDVYFRSYDNYDKIEKIKEWQKPKDDTVFAITPDSDGYLLMDLWGMPPATGVHETCVIPGEYRVAASNIGDKSKVEWGYFTCQRDKLVGEPQPWMEIPE